MLLQLPRLHLFYWRDYHPLLLTHLRASVSNLWWTPAFPPHTTRPYCKVRQESHWELQQTLEQLLRGTCFPHTARFAQGGDRERALGISGSVWSDISDWERVGHEAKGVSWWILFGIWIREDWRLLSVPKCYEIITGWATSFLFKEEIFKFCPLQWLFYVNIFSMFWMW